MLVPIPLELLAVNATLNPYESPQQPSLPPPEYEQRTIVGTFTMDERTQRDAARGYRMRHVGLLVSTLGAIPLAIAVVFLVDMVVKLPGSHLLFLVYGFAVGAPLAVAFHIALDWAIFFHNLRQLRQHPILGATGPWQVRIDLQELAIATARGVQAWPLTKVRRMELSSAPIVIWLERDLVIALPKDGDYDEDDYGAVRKTLRKRTLHIGGELVNFGFALNG